MNKFLDSVMLRKEAGFFDRFKRDDDSNKLARVATQTAAAPLGLVGLPGVIEALADNDDKLDDYISSLKRQQRALTDKLRDLTIAYAPYGSEAVDDVISNTAKINRLSRAYRHTARRLSLADPAYRKYVGRNAAIAGSIIGVPLAAAWLAGKGYDKVKSIIKTTKDDGIF